MRVFFRNVLDAFNDIAKQAVRVATARGIYAIGPLVAAIAFGHVSSSARELETEVDRTHRLEKLKR